MLLSNASLDFFSQAQQLVHIQLKTGNWHFLALVSLRIEGCDRTMVPNGNIYIYTIYLCLF